MTICIGAICDKYKAAVVASDKMVTAWYPPIEFEHDTPKIEELSDTCVALTAGSALAHTELFREVKSDLATISKPLVSRITKSIKDSFVEQRKNRVEELYLKPKGMTLESFYKEYADSLPAEIVVGIHKKIEETEYELEILIVGLDNEGAHIHGVRDPGVSDCYDSLGYNAIGSGELHALSTFMLNNYTPKNSINHAVYLVYEAKRNAEVSQGVGKSTDMCLITDNGIKYLSMDEMARLGVIYEKKTKPEREEISQLVKDLPFGGD